MFALCPTCNQPVSGSDDGYRVAIEPTWRRRLFIHAECEYDGDTAEESAGTTGVSNPESEAVMAQKVQVLLEDDLDGGEATETIAFGLDGTNYEIDLSDENAAALRDAFARYVGAARRAGRSGGRTIPGARSGSLRTTSGPDPKEVRVWASENGINVPDRGRLPKDIIEQFENRNATPTKATTKVKADKGTDKKAKAEAEPQP
jgi:hypothetical protein